MKNLATEIDLDSLIEDRRGTALMATSALPFLSAVRVPVSVRVGQTELSVAELLALKQGAVLPLDALVEQPLDVLVYGHVVARGRLVAVDDHFGVRISEAACAEHRD